MATTTSTLKHPARAALGLAGLGGLFALGLNEAMLAESGLALVLGVSVAVVLVGLPVGMAASRAPVDAERPLGALVTSTTEVWTTVAVAAAIAPFAGELGVLGVLLVAAAWAAAGLAVGLRRFAAVGMIVLALVVGVAMVGLSAVQGPGYSLLEPRWIPWAPWAGHGLLGGLLIASAGLGEVHAPARRGRRLAVGAGIGLLLFIAMALRVATPFELGILDGPVDLGAIGIGIALIPAAVLAAPMRARPSYSLPLVGLAATLALAGPAASAVPFWWTTLFPLGLAALLGLRAGIADTPILNRVVLGFGALASAAIPVLCGTIPPDPWAAALLGLVPVAVVWIAGTRALLVRRAT